MKRAHRRWHRGTAWLLVPVFAGTLALLGITREVPPDNAGLPPALTQTSAAEGG